MTQDSTISTPPDSDSEDVRLSNARLASDDGADTGAAPGGVVEAVVESLKGSDQFAIYSAWLFLKGADRSRSAEVAYQVILDRFGGFPALVEFWATHDGLPRRLAEVISTVSHLSAPASLSGSPEFERLHAEAARALWMDGDIDRAEELTAALARALSS